MRRMLTGALILASLLALSGCSLPGGIAYGVKSIKARSEGRAQPAQPAPASSAPAAVEPEPAPMPTPVQRESIQVEQLPPPQ